MQDGIFVPESSQERRLQDWLLNPFRCLTRSVAFILGLGAILASAALCYAIPLHFDGILDVHFVRPAPAWLFVAEGLSAWLCMALALQVSGALLAPARFSFFDLLCTQALARWPFLVVSVVSFPPAFSRVFVYMDEEAKQIQHTVSVSGLDVTIAVFGGIVTLLMLILSAILMYRGYAISTGIVETRKRVISFLISLIVAEIVCKVVYTVMATKAGVLPQIAPPGA
jgi:hypothetical protein